MKRIVWSLIISALVTACQPRQTLELRPTPVITPAFSSTVLTSSNIGNVVEMATFSGESLDPVIALAFSQDGQELLAFQGNPGILRDWCVKDGTLLDTMIISPTGIAATFDGQGKYLAVADGQIASTASVRDSSSFKGTRVWDIGSGKMLLTTQPVSVSIGLPVIDVALDVDGTWLVEGGRGGLSGWDIGQEKHKVGIANGGTIGEDPVLSLITSVTTDAVGEWFAYATYEGEVTIESRDTWTQPNSVIWRARAQDQGIPLALCFNPGRTELAMVTTKSLIVWDLQALVMGTEMLHQQLPQSPVGKLAFNPDGALLAVGMGNGWQIWSMGDKKLLVENRQPAYALTFSPDGRLFAWGDTSGDIHIWGVPSQ